MIGNDLPYFKFVCELIDAGIWAKMSPAARTLYPVLLRFTDRNFSPVYPGSKKLLELTGFKQKSSLRKARNELIELGLISVTLGNGRKNTIYHFRFDWASPRGVKKHPSEDIVNNPSEDPNYTSQSNRNEAAPGYISISPSNQIQISINHVPDWDKKIENQNNKEKEWESLKKQFGEKNVEKAISEAKLADIPVDYNTIYKILTGSLSNYNQAQSVEDFYKELEDKISENSLNLIKNSFLKEKNGYLIFSDELPLYLKNILIKLSDKILFENIKDHTNLALREGWRKNEY
ncbi:MAG: hypothetical protein KatS3mg129_2273 [Leptospiraceae bacterium]|nr:MAG: hypothetical protein KatS3mg129_2273 [Leptospiraceae bacterium]